MTSYQEKNSGSFSKFVPHNCQVWLATKANIKAPSIIADTTIEKGKAPNLPARALISALYSGLKISMITDRKISQLNSNSVLPPNIAQRRMIENSDVTS